MNRRTRAVKRVSLLLLLLWPFPLYLAVLHVLPPNDAGQRLLDVERAWLFLYGGGLFLLSMLVMLIVRSKKMLKYEQRPKPRVTAPRMVGLWFLVAISPLSYTLVYLFRLSSANYPGLPEFLSADPTRCGLICTGVVWFLMDRLKTRGFVFPASVSLTAAWMGAALIYALVLPQVGLTAQQRWPVLLLMHGGFFLFLEMINSTLYGKRKQGAGRHGGDGTGRFSSTSTRVTQVTSTRTRAFDTQS